jgi:ketosteroid isomerase-like protein
VTAALPILNASDFSGAFANAFSTGKLENVLALYANDAVLHESANQLHRGKDAISAALKPLLSKRLKMVIRTKSVVEVSGVALLQNSFELHDQGSRCVHSANTLEVLTYSQTLGWQLLIDNPTV